MSTPGDQVHFRTDTAWDFLSDGDRAGLPLIDARDEAKALRFITSKSRIDAFAARHAEAFRPYTLFGSGDFHHLSGVWTRQFHEPFALVSFDNHPDWDIRPPRWSCGAWINRALENPLVEEVSIWGCGNFECNFPGRLLGNRAAARKGRLRVHPWEESGVRYPDWLHPIRSESWRTKFAKSTDRLAGRKIYITIDLDCLTADVAVTNWENGRFTCDDLTWALRTLREKADIIGGDLCGAWSPPEYATSFQRLAGWFDHPTLDPLESGERIARNRRAFEQLWPALTSKTSS